MKIIRRGILYLMLAVIFYLLQLTMLFVSFASQLVFYEAPLWSIGGILVKISMTLYQVFAFPFVWIFDQFGIVLFNFQDLPYFLNSLLWAVFGYYLITRRSKKFRKTTTARYQFIRG